MTSLAVEENNNNNIHDRDSKNEEGEKRLRELTKTFTGIDKPLKNARKCETLADLTDELRKTFESDHVNVHYVNHLMLSYESNPAEWRKFAKFDRYRYTRNLVDAGNGKYNLMILCWNEGHASAIHDHADSHCFMKMLKGQLVETRYAWPKDASVNEDIRADIGHSGGTSEETEYNGDELEELSRSTLETNGVCYINDTLGLHRVENPSHTDVAVSLHLYCPPFDVCSIFNKRDGKRTKCKVTFWSKYGKRNPTDAN
ncbi:cysteine dioxygenase type 1 [Anopheles bellator]|uniref:cysteine dioxygenase type 1 n=1 Tax=Anopheles bellator TaxID=139047 RepID=UPI0026498E63|nr:cysteine dioxygenase type 1 [Anopheles bellator]XP_058059463.1 cysteine dioxygenase type 1 [Anopheles bellator]